MKKKKKKSVMELSVSLLKKTTQVERDECSHYKLSIEQLPNTWEAKKGKQIKWKDLQEKQLL